MARQAIVLVAMLLVANSLSRAYDASGFSDYSFLSDYDSILNNMHSEGYEPRELSNKAQRYAGKIEGYHVDFTYQFEDELLVSGTWDIHDTSPNAFEVFQALLLRTYTYDPSQEIETKDVVAHVYSGPFSIIVHVLDVRESDHTVYYRYEDFISELRTDLPPMFAEIIRGVWIIWSSVWGLMIVSILIFNRRWNRVTVGNLVFHLAAGTFGNVLFWTGWYDWHGLRSEAWGIGFWAIFIYSSVFIWRPLTSPCRPRTDHEISLPHD